VHFTIILTVTQVLSVLFALNSWGAETEKKHSFAVNPLEIAKNLPEKDRGCVECHMKTEPGRMYDWARSKHAAAGVGCTRCHAILESKDGKPSKNEQFSPVVSPGQCGMCHAVEAAQFKKSKHARTWEIQTREIKDPWLRGMNSDIERATGCFMCHGSDISSGKLTVENWPNEGCGRLNPDGTAGSCAMCHTSHQFSVAEARRPENCGQCHLGPDHPQDEMYFESKHGKRYLADNRNWNFEVSGEFKPGVDFSTPTCAVCHMSGMGKSPASHDVGERLKWESQAPLTILSKDHDAETARKMMTEVCAQCHSPKWAGNYFTRYDQAIVQYNDTYFKPAKALMDDLYSKKLLTIWPVFDEEIEWEFYEYWHNEGRRARMGSAMMAPDYSWWLGFYDLKKSFRRLTVLAEEARKAGHGAPIAVPGSGGNDLTK
jgi:hydroxylamine dehydrogenase